MHNVMMHTLPYSMHSIDSSLSVTSSWGGVPAGVLLSVTSLITTQSISDVGSYVTEEILSSWLCGRSVSVGLCCPQLLKEQVAKCTICCCCCCLVCLLFF